MLDAALESFAAFGYEGTSVRDLCRQLGISHTLIHQRFGAKDQLWFAAIDHGFEALTLELMRAVVEIDEGDDLERLRAVLVRFVQVTAASPALVRVINQEGVRPSSRLRYLYDHYIGLAMDLLGGILERLQAEGRVRPVPPAAFYFLMANGATGPFTLPALAACFHDRDADGATAPHDHAVLIVDLLLDGFLVHP